MQTITRRSIRFVSALLCAGTLLIPGKAAASFSFGGSSYQIAAVDLDCCSPAALAPTDYGAYAPAFDALKSADDDQSAIPSVWPVHFSNVGRISSYFGYRTDPVTGESAEFHRGLDLADRANTKIYAAGSGTVTEAGFNSDYGLTIVIDHGNGYTTRYSHCAFLLFEIGDTVNQGEIIATMGSSGKSTGVHLDFRVTFDGQYIDPLEVLAED